MRLKLTARSPGCSSAFHSDDDASSMRSKG